MAFVSFMRQAEICRLNSRSPLQSVAADAAAVPHKLADLVAFGVHYIVAPATPGYR